MVRAYHVDTPVGQCLSQSRPVGTALDGRIAFDTCSEAGIVGIRVKQMGDAGFGCDRFHASRGFIPQRVPAEKGEFTCGADMGHMESRTGFPCQFDGQFRRTETSFFVADGRVVFHVRVVSIPFPERFQVGRYDGRVFAMGHDEQGGAAEYGA